MDKLVIEKVSKINGQALYHSGNYIRGLAIQKDKEIRFTIETILKFKNALKIEMKMKYNNRNFPHPVLGISDDMITEFTAELI
ncbi:MAG: hypothetical protein IPQ25_10245 [Chitinophagaceae bacterium]|nr:hypothetical protein [Chitinophagaceae bacterium]